MTSNNMLLFKECPIHLEGNFEISVHPSIKYQLYFHKTLHQNTSRLKKDIYTTKSYGGVGWKANEA